MSGHYTPYMEKDPATGGMYIWNNSLMLDARRTKRNTLIEIVEREHWGLTCYMDKTIQSCLADEKAYHGMLTGPALAELAFLKGTPTGSATDIEGPTPYALCVFGGGEGATARDLLRAGGGHIVDSVDMIEWDEEVVTLFRERYPQWGQGVWHDRRLRIEFADAFEVCTQNRHRQYDWLFVDLFDIEEGMIDKMCGFLQSVAPWTRHGLTLYVTNHTLFPDPEEICVKRIREFLEKIGFQVYLDTQHVPSFHGYAIFLRAVRI